MDDLTIAMPKEAENLQLPSPELITYYRNLQERTLWLVSDVDECWHEYSRKILEWNREDKGLARAARKPIRLMFFSYGGSLDVNSSIVDIIKLSKTPVIGVNVGQACSAACIIFIACHKRLALPNSSFLIHQGSGDNISGTYEQIVSTILEYQRKVDSLSEYLLANTKIPEDILEEKITTEWYLSAEEALSYGICDSIVNSIDELI